MKRVCAACAALFALFILLGAGAARAAPPDARAVEDRIGEAVDSYLKEIDFTSWDEFLDGSGILAQDAEASIRDLIGGSPSQTLGRILESGSSLLTGALRQCGSIMLSLLVIIVFSAVLQRTAGATDAREVGGGASLVMYLCVVSVIGWSFLSVHTLCAAAVERMLSFFDFLYPVLMALLAGTGGLASAAGMQPVMAVVVRILSTVVQHMILPVILGSAVLALLNHLALERNLDSLVGFLRSLCKWTMGTVMTALTAVISIQGVTLAGYDGISIRTAKYTVDTVVPVVGGMLSDLVELMVAGSALVKNAVGTLGLVTLLAIVAQPFVRILAYMLALRMSAAMAGPLGAGRIGKCLEDFSGVVTLWMLTLLISAAFFFLVIFLVVAMGNAVIMYR